MISIVCVGNALILHRYDKLVIAVGSTSATHGVKGLENCYQLKSIGDAQRIRQRIIGTSYRTIFNIGVFLCSTQLSIHNPFWEKNVQCLSFSVYLDNFETASLPTTSPEERRRLLSFVVCGGGPTGVETAAEIFDLCQEDIITYVSAP